MSLWNLLGMLSALLGLGSGISLIGLAQRPGVAAYAPIGLAITGLSALVLFCLILEWRAQRNR